MHGMVKILAYMNLEYFDVIYTPYHHPLKSYMTEHNKYPAWDTQVVVPQ